MTVAASAQENLPEGRGRTLVLEACVQCHDVRALVTQRKSEGQWRQTVNEMIWRGAPLLPGEVDVLTKYLTNWRAAVPAAVAGRPARRLKQSNDVLPPGRGRELVLAACVQCHDLELTVSARKTREDWRRSVEQMARLGAPLNGNEIDVVSSYLARSFGVRTQ